MNSIQILAGKNFCDLTRDEKDIISGYAAGILVRIGNDETSHAVLMDRHNSFFINGYHYRILIKKDCGE